MKKKSEQEVQIKVQSTPQISAGHFANHIQIASREEEFAIDFFARVEQQAVHLARIFITPAHAKRLRDALTRQLSQHEKLTESQTKTKSSKVVKVGSRVGKTFASRKSTRKGKK